MLRGDHELAGAQAHVADRLEQVARVLFELAGHGFAEERGRGLLDELLVATLHGAVTRGVHGEVAVAVAPALGLHVAGLVDEAFDEVFLQIAALQRIMVQVEAAQLVVVVHDGDAVSAAAVGALHHDREAVRVREVEQRVDVGGRFGQAGDRRDLGLGGHAARGDLVSQVGQGLRGGADPDRAGGGDLLGEGGDLGEEPVPRVYGVGAGPLQDLDHEVLVEVGVLVGIAREQIRLVGHAHILRFTVLLGVDGHARDAHLLEGAYHPQGDFAAVRDQHFFDTFAHGIQTYSGTRVKG